MTRTLFSVTLLAALLSSAAAVAQPDHKDEQPGRSHGQGQPAATAPNRGGQDHGRGDQAPAHQAPLAQAPARIDHQGRGEAAAQPERAMPRQPAPSNRGATFQNGRASAEQSRPSRAVAPVERQAHSDRGPSPSGYAQRGAPSQPARSQFVYRGRPHEVIRGPSFSYPGGWGYRRWGAGQSLPFLFLSQSYFFSDYDRYGFGPPPSHYVWVRYGPDLLLVNRRTGRIREVIYGVFY